jgi:hypothetical protein
MTADRNKTELTQNITRNVGLWLDAKGFKPVETEIGVAHGWIADVAGVCTPTATEMLAMHLVPARPKYSRDRDAAYSVQYEAWIALCNQIPQPLTALVEVKVSVADFRGDRKWQEQEWPTNLCYVAMPEGLIDESDWPPAWGVIIFSRDGSAIRKAYPPKRVQVVSTERQMWTILALAVARDHVTRHNRIREFRKEVCLADAERKTVGRIQSVIRMVRQVIGGMDVDRALRWHGITTNLPHSIRADLESLRATPLPAEEVGEGPPSPAITS